MKAIHRMLWAFWISSILDPLTAPAQSATLTTPIFNPAPGADDWFGGKMAAVGSGCIIIGDYSDVGATDTGAAYLFRTDGTLLTTIPNPAPAAYDLFGCSVGALGNERVLVGALLDDTGAVDAGAVYLFRTNGALLATFTNPSPGPGNDGFGSAVAAVGSDRVLISADQEIAGGWQGGVVYLFTTNGTLLTTITNPTPGDSDCFGRALAAMGSDRLLVGAPYDADAGQFGSGAAYLFNTSGTLLMTFNNPAPGSSEFFGCSVAAVDGRRVLIGASGQDANTPDAGAAYLFDTNGTLLVTFTNIIPQGGEQFGCTVAAWGSDWILIGARGSDQGAGASGVAHLFSMDGSLLTTITNPLPAVLDSFGCAVAAVRGDRVVIGAYGHDTGASDAGAAYVFDLTTVGAPRLSIQLAATNTLIVSWPAVSSNWVLQESLSLAPAAWTNSASGTANPVTVPATLPKKFYRLFKP